MLMEGRAFTVSSYHTQAIFHFSRGRIKKTKKRIRINIAMYLHSVIHNIIQNGLSKGTKLCASKIYLKYQKYKVVIMPEVFKCIKSQLALSL